MILEYDADGRETARYKTQRQAAAANGISQNLVGYSIRNPGYIVKGIGRYFVHVQDKKRSAPNCGVCYYSYTNGTGNCFCDYMLITGHRRPCKFAECEIWKTNRKSGRKVWQKISVQRAPMSREQAAELTALIMGKKEEE